MIDGRLKLAALNEKAFLYGGGEATRVSPLLNEGSYS